MLKEDKVSAISEENLIILNPEWGESDADLMKTKMEARRARVKGGITSEGSFYLHYAMKFTKVLKFGFNNSKELRFYVSGWVRIY